jgi:hypothetical protein
MLIRGTDTREEREIWEVAAVEQTLLIGWNTITDGFIYVWR